MNVKHALAIFVGTFVSVAIIARVAPLRSLAGF
jgi:hypothetical protein